MRVRSLLFALAFVYAPLFSQADAQTAVSPFATWRVTAAQSEIVNFEGRTALMLQNGVAVLPDARFETGIVEFDIWMPEARNFPGLQFRIVDDNNFESVYVRPHQSARPDASQYTPVFNGVEGWQIYASPPYGAPFRLPTQQWLHVRLEVAEDAARMTIGDQRLDIPDLKGARVASPIALTSAPGQAYFSNVVVSPGPVTLEGAHENVAMPAGAVRFWQVSQAMSSAQARALAESGAQSVRWRRLESETNGIANLARVAVRSDEADTVLARFRVRSARRQTVMMHFGYSDRARVYLNGALLYAGDASYALRDYRFLGTVGFHDEAPLVLHRGDNEVVIVVTEAFGGWAAAAALAERSGVENLVPEADVR